VTQVRHDLLVFSKKEIILVFILLVLIALLSFTLGLRMGKQLAAVAIPGGVSHEAVVDPPLHEAPTTVAADGDEHGAAEPAATSHGSAPTAASVADAQLKHELTEEKVAPVRKVLTALPQDKVGDAPVPGSYTLQVGAFKSVAEATERVAVLRRKGVKDAHYFAAQVPDKGTWYRVGIGSYSGKQQAEAAGKSLRASPTAAEVGPFIVQRIE
jgi:cell division protein FtsN